MQRRRHRGIAYCLRRQIRKTVQKNIRKFLRLSPGVQLLSLGVVLAAAVAIVLVSLLPSQPAAAKEFQNAIPHTAMLLGQGDADSQRLEITATNPEEPQPINATEPDPVESPAPTKDPSLYEGVEDGPEVEQLQNRLMDLGYLSIDEPTQHFGPATKDAVRRFQRQHALEQDGWAGPLTLDLLYSDAAKKYTLLDATEGEDVTSFQRQLKELGYLNKVTGYYGSETITAVKEFQQRNGLHVDGKAGEHTFDRINSDKAKPSANTVVEKRRKANIGKMISTAEKMLGKQYILGHEGPNSFDCSGLVYYCLRQAGSNRRRLNAAGYSNVSDWEKITSYSKLQKGDLLFFYDNSMKRVGHVGIYIGNGTMIDASSKNSKVVKRSCTSSYWKSHFVCARRPW